jgi:molecular chaperone DnaJ
VRGKGVRHQGGHGDLLVTVEVQVPTDLTAEARAAVEALRDATPEGDPRAKLFEGSR